MKLTLYLLSVSCILTLANCQGAKLTPALVQSLSTKSNVNIMVKLKDLKPVLKKLVENLESRSIHIHSKDERASFIHSGLKTFTSHAQSPILDFISSHNHENAQHGHGQVKVKGFWITNAVYIEGADEELISLLAQRDDVESIDEERIVYLDLDATRVERNASEVPVYGEIEPDMKLEWGVKKVNAHKVWTMPEGNSGEGVKVGIIDTGARISHKNLRKAYVDDNYGWYDPYGWSTEPHDNRGHGTHVTGTILGGYGIGVAPKAKFMSCKGFRDNGHGHHSDLIDCGQFMACPHGPNGNHDEDCSKRPAIVNNSWGSRRQGDSWYDDVIDAWRAFGIIPVASNGNAGPDCHTTGAIAENQNLISVGATTKYDELAHFSSVGPAIYGNIRPYISAPGQDVNSAVHYSDVSFAVYSGTSMASPHVVGVIALLLSYDPNLTYEEILEVLEDSASTYHLVGTGQTCGGISDNEFPNNSFGFGLINAYEAMRLLVGLKK